MRGQVQWRPKNMHRPAIRFDRDVLHHRTHPAKLRKDREVLGREETEAQSGDRYFTSDWSSGGILGGEEWVIGHPERRCQRRNFA